MYYLCLFSWVWISCFASPLFLAMFFQKSDHSFALPFMVSRRWDVRKEERLSSRELTLLRCDKSGHQERHMRVIPLHKRK
jgi:hypothetical protein